MELSLFCPVCGYYEKEKDNLGRRGDFITSVSVGSLFGELLGFQFTQWLEELRSADCRLQIVEAGAHDGRLAKDILTWMSKWRTELFQSTEYCIVEPSPRRQTWQKEMLVGFQRRIRWVGKLSELQESPPPEGVRGIIFSNELLDAMPVRRFGWDARRRSWYEWGVILDGGQFVWAQIPDPKSGDPEWPESLLENLPDGFVVETCPAAESWWREAAGSLSAGKLLAIDYGLTAEEMLLPERRNGTLRSYSRHHASGDLLANAGEQDITAHVNFTAIQGAGEAAGLKTEGLVSQETFLTRVAGEIWRDRSEAGEWTSGRVRQFQTLTHPEHLGRAFRVLMQSRQAPCSS